MTLQPHDSIAPIVPTAFQKIQITTLEALNTAIPTEEQELVNQGDILDNLGENASIAETVKNQPITVQTVNESQLKEKVKSVQNNIAQIAKNRVNSTKELSTLNELQRKATEAERQYYQDVGSGMDFLKAKSSAFDRLRAIEEDAKKIKEVNFNQIIPNRREGLGVLDIKR